MNHIQPLTWRKGLTLSATFLLSIFLITSCKKENIIGQNNIDQNEIMASGGIDTFSLQTFSYLPSPDSIITDNPAFGVLGSYVDPVFGKFNSEIYSQFRLSGLDPDFGNLSVIIVDSFVLALEYIGQYGEPGVQTFEVFEITEDMHDPNDLDSVYYASSTLNTNANDLVRPGYSQVEVDRNKMSVVGGDTLISPQLRIHLDPAKAEQMILDAALGSDFVDNESFLSYFKGLHIKTNNTQVSGEGSVAYFNLNDPASKLTIYYRQHNVPKQFDFLINSTCADFNHVDVDQDQNATAVQTVLNDTISGQIQYYAQAFGPRAVVKIPGLSNIPKNAIIHKAVLVLPVDYHSSTKYTPGFEVSVATILSEGETQLFSVNAVGAYSDYRKSFEVNIRNYVQAIVNDELENTQLIFSPTLYNTSAERIVFNGAQTTNKAQPKLYILYTEF